MLCGRIPACQARVLPGQTESPALQAGLAFGNPDMQNWMLSCVELYTGMCIRSYYRSKLQSDRCIRQHSGFCHACRSFVRRAHVYNIIIIFLTNTINTCTRDPHLFVSCTRGEASRPVKRARTTTARTVFVFILQLILELLVSVCRMCLNLYVS